MRISPSPVLAFVEHSPSFRVGTGMPKLERSRMCEVPSSSALLAHCGPSDAISSDQSFNDANAAKLLRSDGIAGDDAGNSIGRNDLGRDCRSYSTGL
jgi:hypothetical protein